MRFAPLCRGYGAHLVGAADGWPDDPVAAISAFRCERSLLRPSVWFVDPGADRLADAAASAQSREAGAISVTPAWQCLATVLSHLGADHTASGGQPVPVVPGITMLARRLFEFREAAGPEADDALDEAGLLLAGLLRPLLEAGSRAVAIIERARGIDLALVDEMLSPVHRLLAHQGAMLWIVAEDGGLSDFSEFGGEVAGILLPDVDVRKHSAGLMGMTTGYGLAGELFVRRLAPEELRTTVAAVRNAEVFSPVVSASALPETVLAIADAIVMAPTE